MTEHSLTNNNQVNDFKFISIRYGILLQVDDDCIT